MNYMPTNFDRQFKDFVSLNDVVDDPRIKEAMDANVVKWELLDPITKEAKATILEKLQALHQSDPLKMKDLVESFRKKFSIKDTKITRHITTAEHGEFLALEISKIDESL